MKLLKHNNDYQVSTLTLNTIYNYNNNNTRYKKYKL